LSIWLAPFYYHFGHYAWFHELLSIGQELAETVGLYVLVFILIGALIFYRNYLFQIFNKHVLNQPFNFLNRASLFNYNFFFFNILKKTKSIFALKMS
jgi:hypothetical protein